VTGNGEDDVCEEDDVYEEEECGTDNEEEVSYDKVACVNCSVLTHYSVGECTGCGAKFKISKSGYLVGGEDGNFVCDEDEAIIYDSNIEEEEEDDCGEGDDSSESSSSDDEMVVLDEEEEYVYKNKANTVVDPSFRRSTRSNPT
jgi:DNA-directed RNA polymerase subunit RPC12/RpoP